VVPRGAATVSEGLAIVPAAATAPMFCNRVLRDIPFSFFICNLPLL
jgi:hypothetical protein